MISLKVRLPPLKQPKPLPTVFAKSASQSPVSGIQCCLTPHNPTTTQPEPVALRTAPALQNDLRIRRG